MTENNLSTPTIVTCGLPYANGDLHIGHLRGLVAGDVYTRAIRQLGGDAAYVSGSDVHGTPIAIAADENPRDFALSYHNKFQKQFPELDIELDAYGHTDTDRNIETTNHLIQALQEEGNYKEGKFNVAVDDETDEVLPDRYVQGNCPECGNLARGDECEDCGRHLEPGDVENPVSTTTGSEARYEDRDHRFIDLPDYEKEIQSFVDSVSAPEQAKNRANQWIEDDLRPWCITRDLSWGVDDPTSDDRVLYVWIDALSEYISASKLYSSSEDSQFDWSDIWVDDRGDIVHIIGKDIIQHHSILWPALLTSADYALPSAILASGFITLNGKSLSTSRGHAVWAHEYIESGYSPSYLRYFLLSQSSFNNDVDFTWEDLRDTANSTIVNTLGNFLNRVSGLGKNEELSDYEVQDEVRESIEKSVDSYRDSVAEYDLRSISTIPIDIARYGNEYLQDNEPWNKEGDERRQIIADSAYISRAVIATAYPIAPSSMERISYGFFDGEIPKLTEIELSGNVDEIETPFERIDDI